MSGELKASEFYAHDLIPKDALDKPWSVEEDVDFSVNDVSALRPVRILRGDETWVDTSEMRSRAKEKGANIGLADGKWILARQEMLVGFNGLFMPLPGTVLVDPFGEHYIPVLDQDSWGRKWCVRFILARGVWIERAWFVYNPWPSILSAFNTSYAIIPPLSLKNPLLQ